MSARNEVQSNRQHCRLSALVLVVLVFVCNAAIGQLQNRPQSKRVVQEDLLALVVGNGDYPANFLKNPTNDARSVTGALQDAGFTVHQLLNASAKDLRRGLAAFSERIRNNTTVVFYFAGHGLQARGRNYLIPIDAEIKRESSIRAESVDLEEVMEQFAGARASIVILDACRNNPFERRFRSSYGAGLAQVDAPKGTLIAYATSPGKVALDGDDTSVNSIYTAAFVRAMKLRGLRIEETFKRVRLEVSAATHDTQIPWESSSLTGEFCFGGCESERQLSEELDRVKRERETELALLKRERDLLANEKALAEKQKQLLENELRTRDTQQQAVAAKLLVERNEIAESKKRLLDEYEKRLAQESGARAKAEEEVKRIGSASSIEMAKLQREKDLLVNEMALAEKQRQILENQLRERTGQQEALAARLEKERASIASEKGKILEDYEKRLAAEVAARNKAEEEAKRLGVASSLELARLKREKDLLTNEMALAEKQRQILENELRDKTERQQALAMRLEKERDAIAAEKTTILAEYEKRLSAEVNARTKAADEAKKLGTATDLELAKLKREKELLANEKALAVKQREILENELRKESTQKEEIAKRLQDERAAISQDRQRILMEYEKKLKNEASARAKAEDQAKRLGVMVSNENPDDRDVARRLSAEIEQLRSEKSRLEREQERAAKAARKPNEGGAQQPAFVPPMF